MYSKHHRTKKQRAAYKRWREKDPKHYARVQRKRMIRLNIRGKLLVLAHYGKGGKVKCRWHGCQVMDPDMLTLDHIYNDGHKEHRGMRGGGAEMKRTLEKQKWPERFQALCWNHQWKKEIQRRIRERIK
jgi:hypothetical protein